MKNILNTVLLVIVTIVTVMTLAGCGGASGAADGKPLVYTSFYPMYDLAEKAAGEFAEVRMLVPDGIEPHDWEPSPQDIVGLIQAELFFYSGAGFEEWVPLMLPELQKGGLTAVETSKGVRILGGDPHVWLSPAEAKHQFIAMCEALKEADPANAAGYDSNQSYWCAEFDRLDGEFAALRQLPRHSVIVTHEAFGYLCNAYGLEQISASGYSPDSEPDPASLAEIINIAKELQAKVIFYEEPSNSNYAQAIAAEIGAETARLSPIEGLSDEERAAGEDYFSIMRKNLASLKEALE